jgi:hypothetical protein
MSSERQGSGNVSPEHLPKIPAVEYNGLQRERDFQDRLHEVVATRRKLSVGKKSPAKNEQDDAVVVVTHALNAASSAFCAPESSLADAQFFDAALSLAVEGTSRSLRDPETEQEINLQLSEELTLPEIMDVLTKRSKLVILRQQEEIFCLRLMVRELLQAMLRPKDEGFANKQSLPSRSASEKKPSIISTPPKSTQSKGESSQKSELRPSTENEKETKEIDSTGVHRSLRGNLEGRESYGPSDQGSRSPSSKGFSALLEWQARHMVKKRSQVNTSDSNDPSSGTREQGDDRDMHLILKTGENHTAQARSRDAGEKQQSGLLQGQAKVGECQDPSAQSTSRTESGSLPVAALTFRPTPKSPAGTVMDESTDSDHHVFEDNEDAADKVIETIERRMVVLVNSRPINRAQRSMQEQAIAILDANGINTDFVDGGDSANEAIQDKLFAVSGLPGIYPQFFLVEDDGMSEFFGDFPEILRLNNAGELGSTFLRASTKTELEEPESPPPHVDQKGGWDAKQGGLQAETETLGSVQSNLQTYTMPHGNLAMNGRTPADESADTTMSMSFEQYSDGNRGLRWV